MFTLRRASYTLASASIDSDPDVNLSIDVQPYQFEPIVDVSDESSNDDDESETESPFHVNIEKRGNTDWCDCGQCVPMPTGLESKCCQEIQQTEHMCDEAGIQCITQHEYFIDNCLRIGVVWVSLLEFVKFDGPLDDNEPINKAYRFCAYRRFARLIYHRLPKECRKVHPSCVVNKIREAFPAESNTYTGFKNARP